MSLRRIGLRDFVIVRTLDLDWQPGFTVLTGETGAGKSILIDALQLALGARADAGVVREGAARCEVSVEFDAPADLSPWLEDNGFAGESEGVVLLRRQVDSQGRSRAWVNGSAATATQLKALAERLVDIHGQHAWQSLTRPESVRRLLDDYAGVSADAVRRLWTEWREAQQALEQATQRQATLQDERERLQWQLTELDKLAPKAGEWDELNRQHGRLANAQGLIDAAQQAAAALDEAEPSAVTLAQRAIDALRGHEAVEPRLGDVARSLEGALALMQDASRELTHLADHLELDPEALQALDERLSLWMSLARRYRCPPPELPERLQQYRQRLAELEQSADLDALQARVARSLSALRREAEGLSARRQSAAVALSRDISEAMQSLGMAGGRFEVRLGQLDEPQSHGIDQIEFLVAGHAGATPRQVAKVASGGELSRLALAISVTTSRLGQAPTLIFDEVDAGIGGAVAQTVGRLMQRLGADRQVLAVTHLPQVAACAHQHLQVVKQSDTQGTHSQVVALEGERRVQELARMLGGDKLSAASVAHARDMLQV